MNHDTARAEAAPTEAMIRMICGAWVSRAIHTAAVLGLPDLLADGPQTSAALAAATGTDAAFLHRLLRALAIEGVFAIDDQDRFGLTPLGATLRRDAVGSLRDWALLMLGEVHQAAWGDLLGGLRTGESAFQRRHGLDLWAYCREHPEHAARFDSAMAAFTETYIADVLDVFSFAKFGRIVDVGGGDGALLIGILRATARTRGVVFELPHAAEAADRRIRGAVLADRCEAIAGDAFATVPPDGDAYILSRVLHDWDDDAAVRLLRTCRGALAEGGRVLVMERIVPAGAQEMATLRPSILSDIALTDLNMMVMTTGRERTLAEYDGLFARADLRRTRVVPTRSAMQVIELEAPG